MPYNSYNVSSEILILDQLIFFFILITCLLDIVLILYEKIISWSLMRARVNGENDRVVQFKPQSALRSMEESPRKSTLFTVSTR